MPKNRTMRRWSITKYLSLTVIFFLTFQTLQAQAQDIQGMRSLSATEVAPGGTITVTITIQVGDNVTAGIVLDEDIPEGWTIASNTTMPPADGYRGSTHEWVWITIKGEATVEYELKVPDGALTGEHTITGMIKTLEASIPVSGQAIITVSGAPTPSPSPTPSPTTPTPTTPSPTSPTTPTPTTPTPTPAPAPEPTIGFDPVPVVLAILIAFLAAYAVTRYVLKTDVLDRLRRKKET